MTEARTRAEARAQAAAAAAQAPQDPRGVSIPQSIPVVPQPVTVVDTPVDHMAVALEKVSDDTGIFEVIPPVEPEPEDSPVASRARSVGLIVGIGLVVGVGIGFAVYFGFHTIMEMWASTWPENQPTP